MQLIYLNNCWRFQMKYPCLLWSFFYNCNGLFWQYSFILIFCINTHTIQNLSIRIIKLTCLVWLSFLFYLILEVSLTLSLSVIFVKSFNLQIYDRRKSMQTWYSLWAKVFWFHIESWPGWDSNPRPRAYRAHFVTSKISGWKITGA